MLKLQISSHYSFTHLPAKSLLFSFFANGAGIRETFKNNAFSVCFADCTTGLGHHHGGAEGEQQEEREEGHAASEKEIGLKLMK